MYNPGRMTARIAVHRRVVTTVGGASSEVWPLAFATWAEAEELRGSRAMQMDSYPGVARARFWVRDNELTRSVSAETHRIGWDGRTWQIESNAKLVIERGLREIFCQEWLGER